MMLGQRDWVFQQEARKPKAVGETLARFWRYFRAYAHILAFVGLLVIFSTYLQVAIPNLMGQAVDCFLVPAGQGAVASTSAANSTPRSRTGTPATCAGR